MSFVSKLCVVLILIINKELNSRIWYIKGDTCTEKDIIVNLEFMYLWIALYQIKKDNTAFMILVWFTWHYTLKLSSPLYLFALL